MSFFAKMATRCSLSTRTTLGMQFGLVEWLANRSALPLVSASRALRSLRLKR